MLAFYSKSENDHAGSKRHDFILIFFFDWSLLRLNQSLCSIFMYLTLELLALIKGVFLECRVS